MQTYSYQYSRKVVNSFRLAKLRGWALFFKYVDMEPRQVVVAFMRKDMVYWEAFKHVVSKIERDIRLPGPKWEDDVWRKQIRGYTQLIKLEGLLNKCLVLTG